MFILYHFSIKLQAPKQENTKKIKKIQQVIPPDRQSAAPSACGLSAGEFSRCIEGANQKESPPKEQKSQADQKKPKDLKPQKDKSSQKDPTSTTKSPEPDESQSKDPKDPTPNNEMSRKAYKRFLNYLNTHLPETVARLITLTFPPDYTTEQIKKLLSKFTGKLKGNWIWRVEPHQSGAPHIHIIYWGGQETKRQLKELWRKVSDIKNPHTIHISKGRGKIRKLKRYFIKKIKQLEDKAIFSWQGHYWGHKRNIKEAIREQYRITTGQFHMIKSILKRYLPDPIAKHPYFPMMKTIILFGEPQSLQKIFTIIKGLFGFT